MKRIILAAVSLVFGITCLCALEAQATTSVEIHLIELFLKLRTTIGNLNTEVTILDSRLGEVEATNGSQDA